MPEQEVLDELAKRGVRLSVGGCGCCSSPWLTVQIDGKTVFDGDEVRWDNTVGV